MSLEIEFTGTEGEMESILKLAKSFEGVEDVSNPVGLSAEQALNAGVTAKKIQSALLIVTVVFNTSTAGVKFVNELRGMLGSGSVTVSDPTKGHIGRLDDSSIEKRIEELDSEDK
jgi:hypothetical protein